MWAGWNQRENQQCAICRDPKVIRCQPLCSDRIKLELITKDDHRYPFICVTASESTVNQHLQQRPSDRPMIPRTCTMIHSHCDHRPTCAQFCFSVYDECQYLVKLRRFLCTVDPASNNLAVASGAVVSFKLSNGAMTRLCRKSADDRMCTFGTAACLTPCTLVEFMFGVRFDQSHHSVLVTGQGTTVVVLSW